MGVTPCVCVHNYVCAFCVCVCDPEKFFSLRHTKPKGQLPDYTRPVVLQTGRSSVEELCNQLHKSIIKEFKQ